MSTVLIPMKIVSVQNVSANWRAVARRRKSERLTVGSYLGWTVRKKPALPLVVKLTRIAPRPLDSHDNLQAGFKAPVDAICEWLGIKDNDPRVTFVYDQEKGAPKTYLVRLEFA